MLDVCPVAEGEDKDCSWRFSGCDGADAVVGAGCDCEEVCELLFGEVDCDAQGVDAAV